MKSTLENKPTNAISSIKNQITGEVEWSTELPEICGLSSALKKIVKELLVFLLEMRSGFDTCYDDYFQEINRIINLVPVHYLNWNHFKVDCAYFEKDQTAKRCFAQLLNINESLENVQYSCVLEQYVNIEMIANKNSSNQILLFTETNLDLYIQ